MSKPLRTPEDYELFIYSLPDRHRSIRLSTLTFLRLGASLGRVAGEIQFDKDFRLLARERLLLDRTPISIDWYGYEVWRASEKLCWYDSQPHPNEPDLQSTHPHAPQMRFDRPNFPVLIEEVEKLIAPA